MNPLNQRSRSVFVTTYNLPAVEAINWQRLIDTWHLTYAVGNKETCPQTGRLHYHMLLCFDMPIRFKDIQRRLNDFTCNIQPMWGNFKQARDYVTKKGITFEYGEPLEQGKRSDLDRVYESIKVGADLLDIIEENPGTYMRYFKGIDRVRALWQEREIMAAEPESPEVIVYLGKSGTGKSHACWHDPDFRASGYKYPLQQSGKLYFDGYTEQEVIWFDEFSGSTMQFSEFCRIFDKFGNRVETKGSSVMLQHLRKILISTTTFPSKWWPESRKFQEDPEQLWRRLTRVFYIPKVEGRYAQPIELADPRRLTDEVADQIDRDAQMAASERDGESATGTGELGGRGVEPGDLEPNEGYLRDIIDITGEDSDTIDLARDSGSEPDSPILGLPGRFF